MPSPVKTKMITHDIDRGANAILKQVIIAKRKPFVKIGVQADAGMHKGSNTDMVVIASANEYGTRDGRIPERSFIRSTMDENRRKLLTKTKRLLKNEKYNIRKILNLLGLEITRLIQRKITTLSSPPNKPSTIRAKGSDNPLIDTGQLRQTIRHEVVPDGRAKP